MAALCASSWPDSTLTLRPVARSASARKSWPLSARRTASVATYSISSTRRASAMWAKRRSARDALSISARPRRPVVARLLPSAHSDFSLNSAIGARQRRS